jgi:NAD(P)-dependent dehydrogenase (short-subunit alcohol dehydrogenase family)
MPQLPPYQYTGPVDCTIPADPSKLKGKSVIVTGGEQSPSSVLLPVSRKSLTKHALPGANGMGETTVRQFAAAGAYVTIADVNVERGQQLAAELAPNAQFVKCNIVSWDEQVSVFEAAIANSPSRSCDVVIANAGISRASGDSLWPLDGESSHPNTSPRYNTMPCVSEPRGSRESQCVCVRAHANSDAV